MDNQLEAIEHLSEIPGYDPEYVPVYYNSWSTYEEHGWRMILVHNNQYYLLEGGYSVMGDGPQHDQWLPEPITEEHAIIEMIEMDEICNDGL